MKKFKIEGMTCSACSSIIERKLNKLDGVNASVNLTTEILTVDCMGMYSEADIILIVEKLGYKASLLLENTKLEDKAELIDNKKNNIVISLIFIIPLLLVTMGSMLGLSFPNIIDLNINPLNFALIQLFLVLPIMFIGRKFYIVGFKMLFKFKPNMDSLIAVSTSTAFMYSVFATYSIYLGRKNFVHNLYFESAAVIIVIIMFGKYLEEKCKYKTTDAVRKLIKLKPKLATIRKNGKLVVIDNDKIKEGDVVVVKAGESIATDGEVIRGFSSVDESMISGESVPVEKKLGDVVIGGTLNVDGLIEFKVTKTGTKTLLSKIIKMVTDAQGKKAPISRIADTISGYFVVVVIFIALFSSIAWYLYGKDFEFALNIFISVLVIACPCALGLATPTAIMVATGKAASLGILIKSGEVLELMHKINTVVLDKTGTITTAKFQVVCVDFFNDCNKDDVLKSLISAEALSSHPIANAIVDYGKKNNIYPEECLNFNNIIGKGIVCDYNDSHLVIGNARHLREQGIVFNNEFLNKFVDNAQISVLVAINKELVAIVGLEDVVKESSLNAIRNIKKYGISTYMLTGDNKKVAEVVAKKVGVDGFESELMPDDKINFINKIKSSNNVVAMVGDGINDAPALAKSDVGFAISSGTDIAVDSADVILMKDDLNSVLTAIKLSDATIKNIKQNLFWAFFYNVLGLPVASGILYIYDGTLLNPMIAALAMSLSSVSVITNALRLRKFRKE